MLSSMWAMTLIVALGGGPYDCQSCNGGGFVGGYSGGAVGGYYGGGYGGAGGGIYSTGMGLNAYSGSNGDTLLPFDTQEAWMHGYFQEVSPYAGHHYFRPYNYKHVLSQADLAYRWGQPQGMPYSQQWWHRYHARAALIPVVQARTTQAYSAYEIEMARLKAWRDYQAEQQRAAQAQMMTMPSPDGFAQQFATPIVIDPAMQAALEQQSGSRGFVIPAAPLPSGNDFRAADAPMIPEFNPTAAPSAPNLR